MTERPDFDRFRTALRCETPDRVPLAEIDVDRSIKEAWLGHPLRSSADEVEFWRTAGYDYVPVDAGIDFHASTHTTHSQAVGTHLRRWQEEGRGVITDDADFEAHPWPDPNAVDLSRFASVAEHLPQGMEIVPILGGFLSRPTYLMGFAEFCYALTDRPALVARLFLRVGEIVLRVLERILEMDHVGAVWLSNDLAHSGGLLVSPRVLRQQVFPWFEEVGLLCRQRTLPLILHSDGRFSEIIPDLIAVGVNALHPFEPKAMDILELKRRYSGQLCVMGNVDVDLLSRGAPREIASDVRSKIRELAPGGGYCLGSSNSIPDYVPIDNHRAMVETALEYGVYPVGA